ncbi:putative bifunctional diguanylate cyclase/phosphodiesterase [Paenibacillus caseinilyticus]|uniref:putative bifunctional diguanylate cyclase/phosphodiesterase n=1 Tax=Paenibacillus caseinilyticus TaxID=3098138 RepID=UPI0022B8E47B|nr:EAL domain-containing protein [Paenibacillus caseinilyticus]MCZ8519950.1 EAL domain-containing protein [Paenibacillus caseinilyticus]
MKSLVKIKAGIRTIDLITFAVCLVLALLSASRELQLVYGISFSFASIFLLTSLRLFGLGAGVASAAAIAVFMVMGAGEPVYEGVVLFAEVLFLGLISSPGQANLARWDFVYWIAIGLPLIYWSGAAFYGADHHLLLPVLMFSITNGVFNALVADILLRHVLLPAGIGPSSEQGRMLSLGQLLVHLSIGALILPYMIYIVMSSWWSYDTAVQNSKGLAVNTANSIIEELGQWEEEDLVGIKLMGAVQLGRLQDMVNKHTSETLFQITITNTNQRILAGNGTGAVPRQLFQWREGYEIVPLGERFFQRLPEAKPDILPTERWQGGGFMLVQPLEPLPFHLYIQVPTASYQDQVFREYESQLRFLLLFVVCVTLLSLFVQRVLIRALSRLTEATTGLPEKLKSRQSVEWPSSRISEFHYLIFNFREMSVNLSRMFRESQENNARLEEQAEQLRRSEEKLHQLAYYDVLTGLPNRLYFMNYLRELMERENAEERTVAVMFADLNRFKQINDTLGHAAGDELLQAAAQRFAVNASEGTKVFRLGGDEFVLVVEGADESLLRRKAQRIFASFAEPVVLQGTSVYVSTSLGVSIFPRDGQDMDTIVKNADMAMYHAKEQGDSCIRFFDEPLQVGATEKLLIDTGIREALQQGQFRLHYQPKISGATGKVCGMEALIRWQHPELGAVSPDRFIPQAEESGLILDIDKWVLREACLQNKAWQLQGLPALPIAVNISARHFEEGNLARQLQGVLEETGLDARYISLELTEGVFIKNVDGVIDTIEQIKDLGVQISIDDFGTGYSSLSQLLHLPIHHVKLDRSFIENVAADGKKSSVVKAIIELAHSMGMRVVAEGIETQGELDFFMEHRCDELQGYYFSRPLPSSDFARLVSRNEPLLVRQS